MEEVRHEVENAAATVTRVREAVSESQERSTCSEKRPLSLYILNGMRTEQQAGEEVGDGPDFLEGRTEIRSQLPKSPHVGVERFRTLRKVMDLESEYEPEPVTPEIACDRVEYPFFDSCDETESVAPVPLERAEPVQILPAKGQETTAKTTAELEHVPEEECQASVVVDAICCEPEDAATAPAPEEVGAHGENTAASDTRECYLDTAAPEEAMPATATSAEVAPLVLELSPSAIRVQKEEESPEPVAEAPLPAPVSPLDVRDSLQATPPTVNPTSTPAQKLGGSPAFFLSVADETNALDDEPVKFTIFERCVSLMRRYNPVCHGE
ncbi:MAG: hypothetical protein Q4G68_03720 [Planctomycetia bacterium]|nr:hypothetical protein [Planctomycetia bacterium]